MNQDRHQSEQSATPPPRFPLAPAHKSLASRSSSDVGVRRLASQFPAVSRPRSVVETHRVQIAPITQHFPIHAGSEFSIAFEEDPRKYTIIRQFWHAWRAKAIRRRSRRISQYEIADRHYVSILLPLTYETWRQKWRYFAVLQRRVDRDRVRSILTRCVNWWRYSAEVARKQSERIHNEVALRRMFKAWHREVRLKQERLNSITLNNVMERWKAKASTTRDLQGIADRWSRQHTLRRSWKEWFFRTCGVKTVQYHQIKLKQRTLALWVFRMRRIRDMHRHAVWKVRKNVLAFVMTKWKSSARVAAAQMRHADLHRRNQLLFKYLTTWQTTQQLSLRAGLLSDRIDNRVVSNSWARWRSTTYRFLFHFP